MPPSVNHSSSQLQYYKSPASDALLFYDQTGEAHSTFPGDFINTGMTVFVISICALLQRPPQNCAGHAFIAPTSMFWAPTVVHAAMPAEAAFSAAHVAALVSLNDFVGIFGHALYDFLLPVRLFVDAAVLPASQTEQGQRIELDSGSHMYKLDG